MSNLEEQLALLPAYLGAHMQITVVALLLGIGIAVPVALSVVRSQALRGPVMAAVSTIQTIPSLALLALMVPMLSGLNSALGTDIAALGFVPAVIALVLYSMLPVMRNTMTGILSVDPQLREAAQGLGMSDGQVLLEVELPLAMPVIVAGLRTATVWTVGIATLATPVGQVCLGNYIFSGLQTRNWTAVLVGCLAAAGLALVLDALIAWLEAATARRSRTQVVASLGTLGAVVAVSLVAPFLAVGGRNPVGPWVIGTKTFTEQYILAGVVEHQLKAAGLPVQRRDSLGSTVVFDGLVTGQIDVAVDYTGTIWANHMGRDDNPGREAVQREVCTWLEAEHGVVCLGALGFENAYAMAMRRDDAERLGVASLADLAPHASSLRVGGDYEFFQRPEWHAVRDTYGLEMAALQSYDSTFMYDAIRQEQVDVISAFSSDGRIAAYDLVTLDDPKQALPPYDAIVLLSARAAEDEAVVGALRPMVGAIDVGEMRHANQLVDVGGNSVTSGVTYIIDDM